MEDEQPDREEGEEEEEMKKEEWQLIGDEGESPMSPYEEGSGFYEGSASEGTYIADQGFVTPESETGSGETDMDLYKGNFSCPFSSLCIVSMPHVFLLHIV